MKAGILAILTFLLCTAAQSQKRLKVELVDVPEGTQFWLILQAFDQIGFKKIDSLEIKENGIVYFTIPKDQPSAAMQLVIPMGTNQSEFMYNPNENMDLLASFWAIKNGDMVVNNSPENSAYSSLMSLKKQFETISTELINQKKELSVYQPDYRKQWGNIETRIEILQYELNSKLGIIEERYPNTYTSEVLVPLTKIPIRRADQMAQYDGYLSFLNQHFFDSTDFNEPRLLYHYAFVDKIYKYLTDFTEKNEDGTKAGIDVIIGALKENDQINNLVYNNLLETFIGLDSEVFALYVANHEKLGCSLNLSFEDLQKLQTMQAIAIGGQAPDLLLYDDQKKAVSLYQYSSKNKLTIVYIWISWCARCQKETPKIHELFKIYKKKGLGAFAVSLDQDESKWKEAIEKQGTTWTNVAELVPIEQSKVAQNYHLRSSPGIFLIDEKGKVLARNIFGEQLDNFIKDYLK